VSAPVRCGEHGEQAWAAVCKHIADTVDDGVPRGLTCVIDDEGAYQAFCDDCEALSTAEWERISADVHTIICVECLRRAAAANHVGLPAQ